MAVFYIIYFTLGLAMLALLLLILSRIGRGLSECPVNGRMLRAVSVSVLTGFGSIGLGALTLLAIILPMAEDRPLNGLLVALGLAFIGLGVGFGQALTSLRGAIPDQQQPEAETVRQEPDLTAPA